MKLIKFVWQNVLISEITGSIEKILVILESPFMEEGLRIHDNPEQQIQIIFLHAGVNYTAVA